MNKERWFRHYRKSKFYSRCLRGFCNWFINYSFRSRYWFWFCKPMQFKAAPGIHKFKSSSFWTITYKFFFFFRFVFVGFFVFLFVCLFGLNRQVQNSAAITTYKRGLNGRCHFILFWSPWEEKLCIKTIIVHGLKKFNEDLMGILLRIQSSYNQTEIRRSTIQKVQKRSLFETRSLL